MKSLGALDTHYQQEVTTTATCLKFTLRDASVLGYTDHVDDLVFSGVTYSAATGYTGSAVQTSSDMSVDNLELIAGIAAGALNTADLRAGRWDFAAVEIFEVNYKDLTQGRNLLRKGTLGEVTRNNVRFQAELRGLLQALTQSIGRLHMPSCDADLGDVRCGIDLSTFPDGTVSSTITSVSSRLIFADSTLVQAAGWFDNGRITMTSGANVGYSREVKTFLTGLITLQEPMPFTVAVGDAYTIEAGCLKRYVEDCRTKYSNVINFRGFPTIPGTDRLISGR